MSFFKIYQGNAILEHVTLPSKIFYFGKGFSIMNNL